MCSIAGGGGTSSFQATSGEPESVSSSIVVVSIDDRLHGSSRARDALAALEAFQ